MNGTIQEKNVESISFCFEKLVTWFTSSQK